VTELSAAHAAAVTDRSRLAGSAYNSDRDLAARQSLYRWQTPRYDLPGIVAEKLSGVRERGRVVDVGCGNGKFIQRLREDRPDLALLGLDIAPGILADVPGPVAVADATRLPLVL
jgi:SAM-dependent methyltransferase